MFARRAVADALVERRPPAARADDARSSTRCARCPRPPPPSAATREALWRDAGIVRERARGSTRLLDDPHPLARLIARCALTRTESRGAHLRSDYPERDPALDHRHVVVAGERSIAWQTWA